MGGARKKRRADEADEADEDDAVADEDAADADEEDEEDDDDDSDDDEAAMRRHGDDEDDETANGRLFCVCRMPYDDSDPQMVQCDRCKEWYHLSCLGLTMAAAKRLPEYICGLCQAEIANGQDAFSLRPSTILERRYRERRVASRKRAREISAQLKRKSRKPAPMPAPTQTQTQTPDADDVPLAQMVRDERPEGMDDGAWALLQAQLLLQQMMNGGGGGGGGAAGAEGAGSKKRSGGSKKKKKKKSGSKRPAASSQASEAKASTAAEPAGPVRESVRDVVVQTLKETLEQHWPVAGEGTTVAASPTELADAIEVAMFAQYAENVQGQHKCGQEYKAKYRSLLFNLRDAKNVPLRTRVVTGELTPETLVRLAPEELANDELSRWRAEEAARIARESHMSKEERDGPILVSTKKGEEIVMPATAPVVVPAVVPEPIVVIERADASVPPAKPEPAPAAVDPDAPPPEPTLEDDDRDDNNGRDNADGTGRDGDDDDADGSTTPPGPAPAPAPAPTTTLIVPRPVLPPVTSSSRSSHVPDALPSFEEFEAHKHSSSRRSTTPPLPSSRRAAATTSGSGAGAGGDKLLAVSFQGVLAMEGLPEVRFFAHCIDGSAYPDVGWAGLFGATGDVDLATHGRIERAKAEDYLNKVRTSSGHKEIRVLRLAPRAREDERPYAQLADYFLGRDRCGVLKPSYTKLHPTIKDFYLVPLAAGDQRLPPYVSQSRFRHLVQLLNSRGPSLLLVIVRSTSSPALDPHGFTPPSMRTPTSSSSSMSPPRTAAPLPAAAPASAIPRYQPPPGAIFAPAPWTQQTPDIKPYDRQDFRGAPVPQPDYSYYDPANPS